MEKIKEKFYNLYLVLKKSLEKFPITIWTILIITLINVINIDNDFIESNLLEKIQLFGVLFGSGCFLIETKLEERTKKRTIFYVVTIVIALTLTFAIDLHDFLWGVTNEIYSNIIERITATYCISTITLAIYFNYKRSNKTFEEYVTTVFINILKTMIIYGILSIGTLIVTAVFIYLILNGHGFSLIPRIELLILGIYFLPTLIYSFYDMEKEKSKFTKIIIKNVLGTLVIIAFAIIYMYIIKIIILRDMPSNQIFRILAVLFILGGPIWTMIESFKEDKFLDKINKKLPILFIPFIFLQIYSIGIRIIENGVTEIRYLGVMLVILEIIYICMYIRNKEKIGNILLVFLAIVIISIIAPFVNMFKVSELSQYNNLKIYSNKSSYTQEEKDKIYGAYYYLKYSINGEKYLKNLSLSDKNEIESFGYKKINDNLNISAKVNLEGIDIEGYRTLYYIDASYSGSENIKKAFENIQFEIQNSNRKVKVDLSSKIKDYIEYERNIDNYFEENNEIIIDKDRKVVLSSISVTVDEEEDKVLYYYILGYLLEK